MQSPAWLEATPEGIIIRIRVLPNAKQAEIVGLHDGALKIRVQAPAIEGKANAALIAFLAKKFGIPKRSLSILRGTKDRHKIVRIDELSPQKAVDALKLP